MHKPAGLVMMFLLALVSFAGVFAAFDCTKPFDHSEFYNCTTTGADRKFRVKCMNLFVNGTRAPTFFTLHPTLPPTSFSPTRPPTLPPTPAPTGVSYYKFRCLNTNTGPREVVGAQGGERTWEQLRVACTQSPGNPGSLPLLSDGVRNIKETLFSQSVRFRNDANIEIADSPDHMFGTAGLGNAVLSGQILTQANCGGAGQILAWSGMDWGGAPHRTSDTHSCRANYPSGAPWTTNDGGKNGGMFNAYTTGGNWLGAGFVS